MPFESICNKGRIQELEQLRGVAIQAEREQRVFEVRALSARRHAEECWELYESRVSALGLCANCEQLSFECICNVSVEATAS